MATYEIKFATSAAKEFRSLSTQLKQRLGTAIDGLSQDPRPLGVRKIVGHGRLYRISVGRYRIVYEVDDKEQLIRITRVRHRREVYRHL